MADWNLKDKAALAGAGNSPYGRRLGRSPIDLAAEAIANALDDAGLGRDDLDGLIVSFVADCPAGAPLPSADGDIAISHQRDDDVLWVEVRWKVR